MIAVASITPKTEATHNQDSAFCVSFPLYKLMAVADGLGSYAYAELASQVVCDALKKQLTPNQIPDITTLFKQATQVLVSFSTQYITEHNLSLDHSKAFGTTLIVAIETETEFICGYCGNGGIFHIRGNFHQFQPTQYLPWNGINYLNPHTIQNEQGKEALYKLLALTSSEVEITPTLIRFQKDNILFGDMLMICTDGIFSNDQVQIGKDAKGNLWLSGEETLSRFYETMKPLPITLNESLQQYLNSLKTDKCLDDDATLGVMVSDKMLAYHQVKV